MTLTGREERCRNGHRLTERNVVYKTYSNGRKYRHCLICDIRQRERTNAARRKQPVRQLGMCRKNLHELTKDNVYQRASGYTCIACRRIAARARQARLVRIPCIARSCLGHTSRRQDDGTPYVCPKHRRFPTPAVCKALERADALYLLTRQARQLYLLSRAAA